MVLAYSIVAQTSKCMTRFCFFIILLDVYASDRVTSMGRSSGTATTKTAMVQRAGRQSVTWARATSSGQYPNE